MKLPPFTLVHSGRSREPKGLQIPKEGGDALRGLKGNLRRSLLMPAATSVRTAPNALSRVLREMTRQHNVITVGIWDLGAWIGGLPAIVETLNAPQPDIVVFEIQAAIPAGLVSTGERIAAWATERLGRHLKSGERTELTDAIIDVEFFQVAKEIRKDLGIDYLVGITPNAIAGEVNDEDGHVVHSDFFSSHDGRTVLASTIGLRSYAAQANRSFEFAVGIVFLSSLLAAINDPRVTFHMETRGCIFDYNYERSGIVNVLRAPRVCDECMTAIRPRHRKVAQALLSSLTGYPGRSRAARKK